MLWPVAEWAGAVLTAGVIAGLTLLGAAVAGAWWLRRRVRRAVGSLISAMTWRAGSAPGAGDAGPRGGPLPLAPGKRAGPG